MKELKLFEGPENEQLFICSIITDRYSDEILGVKGLYYPTVEILVETTKAFYKDVALNITFDNLTVVKYVNKISKFAKEYIEKNYGIDLTDNQEEDETIH